jgi:hypothetical protein
MHDILNIIRDYNLTLISINSVEGYQNKKFFIIIKYN